MRGNAMSVVWDHLPIVRGHFAEGVIPNIVRTSEQKAKARSKDTSSK